jgi:translation initiation factor 2B subunit (eIF-2B alpha/beta/delta family)
MPDIIESTKTGEKQMDSENLVTEIRAYREILQKGRLTEIDLDAISDRMAEVESTLDELHAGAAELKTLKEDVIDEIVKLVRASKALTDGVSGIDVERMNGNLKTLDAAHILAFRNKMRTAFANLQRKDDFPRRVDVNSITQNFIEDYKIDNARV